MIDKKTIESWKKYEGRTIYVTYPWYGEVRKAKGVLKRVDPGNNRIIVEGSWIPFCEIDCGKLPDVSSVVKTHIREITTDTGEILFP